jgi:uncharacterized protein DUF5681
MPKNTKISTQRSAKPKGKPRGKPFQPGHKWRWPKGVSGNPGGEPRGISKAYAAWLELACDENLSITNAQAIALAMGENAIHGNTFSAKEIRQATEGDKSFNFDLSKATNEQLERIANGEDPAHVLASQGEGGAGVEEPPEPDNHLSELGERIPEPGNG